MGITKAGGLRTMREDRYNEPAFWPAVLTEGPVRLRPIRKRDGQAWQALREQNEDWLGPWDATSPTGEVPPNFHAYARSCLRAARQGLMLPWVIEYEGLLVGQLSVNGIARGAAQQAAIGYWVSEHVAGRGIAPTAVAMAFDHAINVGGLHRLEVAIRPENKRSLRVADKLGFRPEGLRLRSLHVDGDWRDHLIFALTAEEVPGGLLARWRSVQAAT
ncbi:MAG: GNAT family N-acetyltransferase [Bifidobacteriaceae bacterium]|nr:GNAT family N-acetyltransferase [Bifidobacteriaceae bacterium]